MTGIVRRSAVVLSAVALVGSTVMVGAPAALGVSRVAPPPVSFSSRADGAGPSVQQAVAADINGDGNLDLPVTNLGTSYRVPTNDGVVIRLGRGDGSFTPTQQLREMWPTSITAADLDGDGAMDLIVPNESSAKIVVFINRG